MAIEQRADDAAVQNSRERLIFLFRPPFRDDFAVLWKTADVQTFRICGPAAEARILGRVLFLQRLFRHGACPAQTLDLMRRLWVRRDSGAALAQCKGSADGSIDCDRVARRRARTSQPRARQQKSACSVPAGNRAW